MKSVSRWLEISRMLDNGSMSHSLVSEGDKVITLPTKSFRWGFEAMEAGDSPWLLQPRLWPMYMNIVLPMRGRSCFSPGFQFWSQLCVAVCPTDMLFFFFQKILSISRCITQPQQFDALMLASEALQSKQLDILHRHPTSTV
uniref:Uncharacterized protein n=1 Tax=Physcomitrium patens TaxID=3218 RepID=A0A2K1JDA0_PHYPA|nr:hypothetical protein PHYPA_019780 [Physcomitrium patens]